MWGSAAALLGVSAWYVATAGASGMSHVDFDTRYAAALLLRNGHAATAYSTLSNGLAGAGGLPSMWMPPALLLILPLTWLPIPAAAAIWDVMQLALLAAAAALVSFRTISNGIIPIRWRLGATLLGFAGIG